MSIFALCANKSTGCGRGPAVDPSPAHVLQGDVECDAGPLHHLATFTRGNAGLPANRKGWCRK